MSVPITQLPPGRIASVDAFRGLTFVLMLFVNFLAGATAIPAGIHHVAADVDGMGLADVVFPAFLFAVGMSIPFALNARLVKGDSLGTLLAHVGMRGASLVLIGVFMVNMEAGYNEAAMGISMAWWSLVFYAALGLVWGAWRAASPRTERLLRAAGLLVLALLAATYRSGADGNGWMSTQWWGILGCIGWAYLAASAAYLLARGKLPALVAGMVLCVLLFWASHRFNILHVTAMHATHTSIALAGTLCALLFFDTASTAAVGRRQRHALGLAMLLAGAAALLHQAYPVSKIGGTPSWALYCAALCCLGFTALHWLLEVRRWRAWTVLVEPAASSPLVTYLLPFVLGVVMTLLNLAWLPVLVTGLGALAFAVFFSFAVVAVVAVLNQFNFKLKL